jgi:DHA2 family multidrug resistance protein
MAIYPSGIGMAFMMSPVMALSLQGISPMDIPQAAGINNMIRQLGGAIGVALMTVVLEGRNAVNYDYLLQHLSEYSEITQDRLNMISMNFQSQGFFSEDARQIAYRLMERSLFRQEALVSYNNIFWAVAISLLLCLPVIFLIRRNEKDHGKS